jgi:hypothetical protein
LIIKVDREPQQKEAPKKKKMSTVQMRTEEESTLKNAKAGLGMR